MNPNVTTLWNLWNKFLKPQRNEEVFPNVCFWGVTLCTHKSPTWNVSLAKEEANNILQKKSKRDDFVLNYLRPFFNIFISHCMSLLWMKWSGQFLMFKIVTFCSTSEAFMFMFNQTAYADWVSTFPTMFLFVLLMITVKSVAQWCWDSLGL